MIIVVKILCNPAKHFFASSIFFVLVQNTLPDKIARIDQFRGSPSFPFSLHLFFSLLQQSSPPPDLLLAVLLALERMTLRTNTDFLVHPLPKARCILFSDKLTIPVLSYSGLRYTVPLQCYIGETCCDYVRTTIYLIPRIATKTRYHHRATTLTPPFPYKTFLQLSSTRSCADCTMFGRLFTKLQNPLSP